MQSMYQVCTRKVVDGLRVAGVAHLKGSLSHNLCQLTVWAHELA